MDTNKVDLSLPLGFDLASLTESSFEVFIKDEGR